MDGDRSLVKWATAAVATVIGCFLLGYFVVPWGREATPAPTNDPEPKPVKVAETPPVEPSGPARLDVTDITDKKREESLRREQALREAAERARELDPEADSGDSDSMTVTLEPDSSVEPSAGDTTAEGSDSGASSAQAADPNSPPAPGTRPQGDPPGKRPSGPAPGVSERPQVDRPGKRTRRTDAAPDIPAPDKPVPPPSDPDPDKPTPRQRNDRRRAKKPEQRRTDRTSAPDGAPLTKVRVGDRATSKSDADRIATKLRANGFKPAVLPEGDGYVVQLGAFKDRRGADSVAEQLRAKGFDPVVR